MEKHPADERANSQNIGYGEQDENGIDLSLIRANLRLTPAERLQRAEQTAKSFAELRRARRVLVQSNS